jgi:hypothetical protein
MMTVAGVPVSSGMRGSRKGQTELAGLAAELALDDVDPRGASAHRVSDVLC